VCGIEIARNVFNFIVVIVHLTADDDDGNSGSTNSITSGSSNLSTGFGA
jgi:hypothetical protein